MKILSKSILWGAVVGIVFFLIVGVADIFIGTVIQTILFFVFSPVCMILQNTNFVGGNTYTGVCIGLFGLPFNILFYGFIGLIVGSILIKIKHKN